MARASEGCGPVKLLEKSGIKILLVGRPVDFDRPERGRGKNCRSVSQVALNYAADAPIDEGSSMTFLPNIRIRSGSRLRPSIPVGVVGVRKPV